MKTSIDMMSPMTHRVRHTIFALAVAIPLVLTTTAQAASRDDDEEIPDARLMGYTTPVNLGGGNAGNYIMAGLLAFLTCGILFKNANRSHLD